MSSNAPIRPVSLACLLLLLSFFATAQKQEAASGTFEPFEQWKSAVSANDAAKLRSFYATEPELLVRTAQGDSHSPDTELEFWPARPNSGREGVKFEVIKIEQLPDGTQYIQFLTEFKLKTEKGLHSWYLHTEQVWHKAKDGGWRIVAAGRGPMVRLRMPLNLNKILFRTDSDAKKEIAAALTRATREHKRVLLDFGGNWCLDCHVLDMAFELDEVHAELAADFILVHVDVGEFNKNLDLAEKYKIPLKRGVPALAVLGKDGKLLFSQETGEFESARSLAPEDIIEFLKKWKPAVSKQ